MGVGLGGGVSVCLCVKQRGPPDRAPIIKQTPDVTLDQPLKSGGRNVIKNRMRGGRRRGEVAGRRGRRGRRGGRVCF